MRKILSLLMATVLILAFATAAGASDFNQLADDLAAIGMLQGTGEGYDLDREPTRAEVAVMLVRMLGAEGAAKAGYIDGSLTHPFSDVPEWAAPYIAYLYTKGLTSGVTDTEFGSTQLCSGQMYCTFMLRALGYSDAEGGDFTYTGAVDFAQSNFITYPEFISNTFTRDELVAVSCQTLFTRVKGSETTLLEKLVSTGAINSAAVSAIMESPEIMEEFITVLANNIINIKALDCTTSLDLAASAKSGNFATVYMYDYSADLKFILKDIATQAEISVNVAYPFSDGGENYHAWVKDGWMYFTDGDEHIKVQIDYPALTTAFEEAVESSMDTGMVSSAPEYISYMFSSVTKTETDEGTLYGFVLSPKFVSAVIKDSYASSVGDSDAAPLIINIGNISQTVLVKDGNIKSISLDVDASMQSDTIGEYEIQMSFDLTVNKAGDDVTIDFPDFSGYVEEGADTSVGE